VSIFGELKGGVDKRRTGICGVFRGGWQSGYASERKEIITSTFSFSKKGGRGPGGPSKLAGEIKGKGHLSGNAATSKKEEP